jgi:hypothetical protein
MTILSLWCCEKDQAGIVLAASRLANRVARRLLPSSWNAMEDFLGFSVFSEGIQMPVLAWLRHAGAMN